MAKRKIIWTDIAKKEFKETLEFYNRRNGNKKYSKNLLHEIRNNLFLLQSHPYLGKPSNDNSIRIFTVDFFQVYYEIQESKIDILVV